MQVEQTAMHRMYDQKKEPKRELPKVGLPRRRIKYAKKLPMNVKRQLRAEVERLRKEMQQKVVDSNGTATDSSDSQTTA